MYNISFFLFLLPTNRFLVFRVFPAHRIIHTWISASRRIKTRDNLYCKEISKALGSATGLFLGRYKLTDGDPLTPGEGLRGVGFPLQILSLPLLYSPPRPPRRRRRLPPLFLRGFVLARTRPGFWIRAYTHPHTDDRSRKLRNLHRNRRLRGEPADLYWFLPSNTQSDIFLLRRSTRLAPNRALFSIKRGKRLRSEGVKVPSHEGRR